MALQYVGGKVAVTASIGDTVSLTDLSGGLASAPAQDDIVIVIYGSGSNTNRPMDITSSGWTEIAEQFANSTKDANSSISYKVMGATPDTSFDTSNVLNSSSTAAVVVHCWRGVDTANPLDVTSVTTEGTGTGQANPPSATPVTSGAVAIAYGVGATTAPANFTSSDLSNFLTTNDSNTHSMQIGMGSIAWGGSGAIDPAQFGGGSTDSGDSWTSGTLVLRPAAGGMAYTLTADAAAYSFTPAAAGLLHGFLLTAENASYAFAGADASLGAGSVMAAEAANYALSAADAGITRDVILSAAAASYGLAGADAGLLAGAGTTPTTFPTTPDAHYHPNSQSATLNGSNQVTSCPDIEGLAALSGISFGSAEIGPHEMTDGLGRKFWRFTGGQYLLIANALTGLSARAVTVFAVVRKHNHKNISTDFFSPRYSAYTDDSTNTTYSGGSTMRTTSPASSAANFIYGAGVGAHTDATNGYKIIPGTQVQVIGVSSRTTANGGQRLYVNEDVASVAQSGVGSTNCTGGVIGGRPGASNAVTSGNGEWFDLYELAIWNSSLTNSEADALAAAMVANWSIEAITRQLLIDGDSITDGIATSLSVSPTSGDNIGMQLTEPGTDYVPADVRVINAGASGNQTTDIETRRDVTNGIYSQIIPGGAANNIVAFQIGRNDVSPSGGNENSDDLYNDVVALINTTTTGMLQRGWQIKVVANIATAATATTTNNLPGEDNQQLRLENYRALIADTTNHVPQGTFLDDVIANTGDTYDGLVDVIHLYDVTVSGDTKFKTSTDAQDTASGYYDNDQTHLRVAGIQLMASGGDMPEYGYGSIYAAVPASLSAEASSFSVSISDASLLIGSVMPAAVAAYSYAAGDVTFLRGIVLTAQAASYATTFADAVFSGDQVLGADAASFTLTVAASTFDRGLILPADAASFAFSGAAMAMIVDRSLSSGAASYALSVAAAGLYTGFRMQAGAPSFAISVADAAFYRALALSAGQAIYSFAGADADMAYSGAITYAVPAARNAASPARPRSALSVSVSRAVTSS